MDSAIGLVKFGKAMAYQRIFALQIDVFLLKEVHNLTAGELVAISVGCRLHNIAKLRMHFLGQVVAHSLLQHKGSAALAGLAVDADYGLVFTMQIGRIDGQIRNLPVLGAAVFHIFIAFANSILMGAAEGGEGQLASVGLTLGHAHLGAFLVNLFDSQNIGKVQLRLHALSEHV